MPYIKRRVLRTKDLASFKRLISERYHSPESDIEDKELAKQIDELGVGCFVVVYELPEEEG
jgi:hypothetical protein